MGAVDSRASSSRAIRIANRNPRTQGCGVWIGNRNRRRSRTRRDGRRPRTLDLEVELEHAPSARSVHAPSFQNTQVSRSSRSQHPGGQSLLAPHKGHTLHSNPHVQARSRPREISSRKVTVGKRGRLRCGGGPGRARMWHHGTIARSAHGSDAELGSRSDVELGSRSVLLPPPPPAPRSHFVLGEGPRPRRPVPPMVHGMRMAGGAI